MAKDPWHRKGQKHERAPRETWRGDDRQRLKEMPFGTKVRVDHPWVQPEETLHVSGPFVTGRRVRVARVGAGGTLALPWETPVIEVVSD